MKQILPLQEKFVLSKKIPTFLSWGVISILMFLFQALVQGIFERSLVYLYVGVLGSVIIFSETSAIILTRMLFDNFREFLNRLLDLPKEEISHWYNTRSAAIFSNKSAVAAGITVGFFMVISVFFQLWFESIYTKVFSSLCLFFNGFWAGAGIYVILSTVVSVSKLKRLTFKFSACYGPGSPLRSTTMMFLKFSLLAVGIYSLWLGYLIISPMKLTIHLWLWIVIMATLMLFYLIIPQINLRYAVNMAKQRRIDEISNIIEQVTQQVLTSPNAVNVTTLANLIQLRTTIVSSTKHLFGWESSINVFVAFVPLVLSILTGVMNASLKTTFG